MKVTTLLLLLATYLPFFGQKQVSIGVAEGALYGTLLTDSTQKGQPAIYFIGGSGPATRNGAGESQTILAQALFEKGIGSLSVDKRGAGESAAAAISEDVFRIDTLVNDAIRWIDFLSKEGYTNIIVAGHSQGSLIGMLAVQKTNAKKFISLAGAGRTIDLILKEQFSGMLPVFRDSASSCLDSLKKGVLLDTISPYLYSIFRPSVQPFLINWMKIDPVVEIQKLTIPVLIVQGTTDIQVKIEDAELLHKALPSSQLELIEGMNHIFRDAPLEREPNIATYTNSDLPVTKELIEVLSHFVIE